MTSNGAAAISANRAVIAAHKEPAAGSKNVLKRISAVSAELQHATVETDIRINV